MSAPIRLNAFQMASPSHQSPGLWTHPADRSAGYHQPEHWIALARLLERGLFDAVFLADVMGVYDVYGGSADAALRGGVQVPLLDPLLVVPWMAAHTEHLGFGVTCTVGYEHPVPFARRIGTLDHLTRGRIGWNIVTGYLDSAARNLGEAKQLGHDARYDAAEEYLEVVYKLWEHSWEDGAVRRDAQQRLYTDPGRVHAIGHRGAQYSVPGIHLVEPSPQRTPVLFQAGTSPRGLAFAARHAECVFISGPSVAVVGKQARAVRDALQAAGRPRGDVRIYAQALVVTGEDDAAAEALHAQYRRHVDPRAALALLSGWTGIDFSRWALDAPIEHVETEAGRTALASFTTADPKRRWTVREAAEFVGLGGRGPVFVGGTARVADEMEHWVEATGVDGFNLSYAVAHQTMELVVERIVPELQRRGRYPRAPRAGTLRDRLFGAGDRLPAHHTARTLAPWAAAPAADVPSPPAKAVIA
ncbi:MAG: LLM class flavin-dependent oxidoreductase [Pseudomonadota bacterium]